jgi:methylmalonyl-CoA mutase cobalamin-binding subunit
MASEDKGTPGKRGREAPPPGARLSIGALAQATGVTIETLRTWERRYGFPVPQRTPAGHRVYSMDCVSRVRRIAEVLACGHRAGHVVCASEDDLGTLLGMLPPRPVPQPAPVEAEPGALLGMVARFDGAALTTALNADFARMGPLAFLQRRAAPLARAVGDAWEAGRLEIRHEHFLSERLGDLLRAYRLPFEERSTGPRVVLATLPGEAHALGLQMVALAIATSGCRVCYVGTEVPVAEVAAVVHDLAAVAIGISVSSAMRPARAAAQLAKLRTLTPSRVGIVAGGEGAPSGCAGVRLMSAFGDVANWAMHLRTGTLT